MPFSRFWDITLPLATGMMNWPGDTPFSRTVRTTKKGDQLWSNSEIKLGCHAGTHMDAPRHVFESGGDINSIPLAVLLGECRVVETTSSMVGLEEVEAIRPRPGERVLFKTLNTELFSDGNFHKKFIHFDEDGASALVRSQVVLAGIDGPSVDGFGDKHSPAHTAFCSAGIAVVENLYLVDVDPGEYFLICLPMKLEGSDGAPVRAILAR